MRTFGPLTHALVATCFAITLAAAAPPPVAKRLQLDLIGLAASDQFGYSVASAGDFNGDGFDDIVVGAPFVGATNAGAAYVFFGGPSMDAVADVTINGSGTDSLGWSVASAGDINGDGFDDIIVGAPGVDSPQSSGRAYVFFGGAVPNNVADLTFAGGLAGSQAGYSVSSAGDYNGDGYDDVLVGEPTNQVGFVILYFGGANPAQVNASFGGSASGDQYGYSVAPAGDINSDGFDDFIVGAPLATGTDAGQAIINFGHLGGSISGIAPVTLAGLAAGDHFGTSVASAGDVNADGFDDVIVGAPLRSVGFLNQGQAYVWFGGNPFNTTADITIDGWDVGYQAGSAVASAGDVNGDGFDDFLVASPFHDVSPNGPFDVGRVDLYYGGNPPDIFRDLIFVGVAGGDKLGFSVGSAGDVNGDGFADVLVGTPLSGATDVGRVQLYDFNRYHLLSPTGGALWNVGASQTISWLGAEPADVWLSVDGGLTYDRLETGIGGGEANAVSVRVPHSPTRFARVKITPTDPAITGRDRSDSLFTIQSSVALLSFAAKAEGGSVMLTWASDPGVGPQGLAGYRLYRVAAGIQVRVGPEMITETRYTDTGGSVGTAYRLFAVNGLGEELLLGETGLLPARPLAAWPLPYRGGELSVSFTIYARVGESGGDAEVMLFDLGGRVVRTIARGRFQGGEQRVTWDGRDDAGLPVRNGIYFLHARSGSERHRAKVVVMR